MAKFKHGMMNSPEHRCWQDIKQRTTNKKRDNFCRYGAKGIKVCERWSDAENGFLNFLSDMGKKPGKEYSIDRKDSKGDYCPENCKWTNLDEQSLNRTYSKGKSVFRGIYLTQSNKWQAQLRFKGTLYALGVFENEKDSAWEYLKEYYELHNKLPPEYPKDYDIENGSLIPCR